MSRSALLSFIIHAVFIAPAGFTLGLTTEARTDVIRGVSSIELEHVFPSAEAGTGSDPPKRGQTPSGFFDDGGAFQRRVFSGLCNPAPRYPWSARVNGWQGRVFVQVRVTPEGRVGSLQVNKSSGYPVLDSAACEAVRHWEFIPARQGSRKVASTVEIPITFMLQDKQ